MRGRIYEAGEGERPASEGGLYKSRKRKMREKEGRST